MHNANGDDKEIQFEDRVTTHLLGSNISYIRHFGNKKYLVLFKNSNKYIRRLLKK